jgi:hypothetical protein
MASDPELAVEIKSVAKGLAYNLASFTWPGWDEPGMVISQSDVAIGLDAAKTNLRLANELAKGDLPLSRAYWMLGGHYLASGNWSQAEACFNKAKDYAETANEESERLLARGFSLLAVLLASPDNVDARNQLDQVKSRMAQLEQGESLVKQIDTARAVFAR